MKISATLSLIAGCVFLSGVDTAEAQCSRSRGFRRVVVAEPTYVVSRPVVTYGGFSHIDDLAVEIEQRVRDILWEMHFNYAHNPGFAATYSESYGMLTQARRIHQAEHRGNRARIARLVTELDRLFHHIEDDIHNWRPSHHHLIGGGNLFDKMEAMELTLHHLMQDVGLEASNTDPPAPVTDGNPPAPLQTPPPSSFSSLSQR